MRQRAVLIAILITLAIILGVLVYLYLTLVRPLGVTVSPREGEITHIRSIYGYGKAEEEMLEKPHGVAVDEDGNVYITDSNHHRVLVFTEDGRFIKKIGKEGSGKGELKFPLGIAVDEDKNVYVCDKLQSKIVIYDSKGNVKKEISEMMPLIPTVYDNKLYVVTYGHVAIYTLDGELITKWGRRGKLPGQFDFPGGIVVGKKGIVYVSDSNNMRIQALDKNGEILWVAGKPPKSMNDPNRLFGLSEGIALDDEGRLYVVDAFRSSIFIFSSRGKKLAELGKMGNAEGEFYYPAGIAHVRGNLFWIADKYNDRVQLVRITPPTRK